MNIGMIDTLSFGVEVEGYPEVAEKLLQDLEEAKEKAKALKAETISEKIIIPIGSMSFQILSNGVDGYAFILHNEEYEIKLAQFRSKNKNFYPVKIRIKSDCLWSQNPFTAYKYIMRWVNNNIGNVLTDKINRMDLCCHTDSLNLTNESLESFKGLFKKTNKRTENRKVSSFEFGTRSGKVYCRIYDKCKEIQDKRQKFWFYNIWTNAGMNTENVWNVEFELKRDFFREYNIDSIDDAFNRLKTIWEHCTFKWLVNVSFERTRIENCPISEEWKVIQTAFDEFEKLPLIKRQVQFNADADSLIPAIWGYLTTISARLGIKNINELFLVIKEKGLKYLGKKSKSFKGVVEEKMLLLTEMKGGEEDV